MLHLTQCGDAPNAHQPHQQQAGNLLGPWDRPVQSVAADHLQAHDGGLGGDEDSDRPLENDIRPTGFFRLQA